MIDSMTHKSFNANISLLLPYIYGCFVNRNVELAAYRICLRGWTNLRRTKIKVIPKKPPPEPYIFIISILCACVHTK